MSIICTSACESASDTENTEEPGMSEQVCVCEYGVSYYLLRGLIVCEWLCGELLREKRRARRRGKRRAKTREDPLDRPLQLVPDLVVVARR